jgi:O-antigen/teichoic acid export membrane protein
VKFSFVFNLLKTINTYKELLIFSKVDELKMNSYKKLINNSIVFAIGNLGSKFIIVFLVPLYTFYLTTNEFGRVDLITTTINLMMPIITFSIADSVLRFVMDKNYDREAVFSNSLLITVFGFFILLMIYPILLYMLPFDDYLYYFYLILFFQSVFILLTQFIRAKNMVRLYALSGICNALFLIVSNVIFLMLFNMGIVGYLLSLIVSNIFGSIFVIIGGNVHEDFNLKKVNNKLMIEMLRYSIPLIPNSVMWWIIGFSDRYLLTFFGGLSANGIYAVANRIPSILNIVNSIFFQAWQMSAIEEADSKNKPEFYTNVFNVFSIFMFISTSLLLVNLKILMGVFVSDNFFEAWRYIPFLLLGVVFSSFSSFLGANYIVNKNTLGVFKTSAIGAIINIFLNLLFIPLIGIYGAAIGTMISFAVIWLLRIKDTKKIICINLKKILLNIGVILLQISVLYINLPFNNLIQIAFFLIIILLNLNEVKMILEKTFGRAFNKKHIKTKQI